MQWYISGIYRIEEPRVITNPLEFPLFFFSLQRFMNITYNVHVKRRQRALYYDEVTSIM